MPGSHQENGSSDSMSNNLSCGSQQYQGKCHEIKDTTWLIFKKHLN